MSDVSFDRLRNVDLRDAWKHEAHKFTPWLAENIDHIADAVSMKLERTGVEVPVGGFKADILARRLHDDGVVLIENQLEQTDHAHLGQIMTYLAGLEAKSVIWVAAAFREPHLSAIRWLNEHTHAEFSFFALRLRVVQIGGSPYAPIFEVVEKPIGWDEEVRETVDVTESELSRKRTGFWSAYLRRFPDAERRGLKPSSHSNQWIPTAPTGTRVGLWITAQSSGIYVRASFGAKKEDLLDRLMPFQEQLERRLGVPLSAPLEENWLLVDKSPYPGLDETRWPELIDWMQARATLYLDTLADLFGPDA